MPYVVPAIFLTVLILSLIKKQNTYSVFIEGSKTAVQLMIDVLPYLLAVMMAVELFKASGVSAAVSDFAAPALNLVGIPKELTELIIVRPLSGAGALAVLDGIYKTYGTDTYIGQCASIIYGSSETVFYLASIYFSKSNVKKLGFAIPAALFSSFVGSIAGCFAMRFF